LPAEGGGKKRKEEGFGLTIREVRAALHAFDFCHRPSLVAAQEEGKKGGGRDLSTQGPFCGLRRKKREKVTLLHP